MENQVREIREVREIRDDRPAVYVENGVAIYRASSVGLCADALVALRMGVQPTMPPDWMLEKYEEGAQWEGFIVEQAMKNHGLTLMNSQERAGLVVAENILIRGSTDGTATTSLKAMTKDFGVEAKKLGPRLFENWQRGLDYFFAHSPYYRDQLTIYMEAMQVPFIYAVGEWDPEAKKVVKVHTTIIEEPPSDIEVIKAKVRMVEERARAGDLGICDGKESWPCPVYFLHEEKDRAEVADELRHELSTRAQAYLDAHGLEQRAKAIKTRMRDEIMGLLSENGYVDLEAETVNEPEAVDGVKITPFFRKNTRLDKKAMEEDGIVVSDYETTTTSVTLKITRSED